MKPCKLSGLLRWIPIALLLLLVAGCNTLPEQTGVLSLTIAGDPGVTVRVVPTTMGTLDVTPDVIATVPTTMQFTAGSYDLRCIHGSRRGRLSLSVTRDNYRLAADDTFESGDTLLFKVRRNSITVRLLSSRP